ncbi:MAG TPA: galactokinase [Gemmataceae bacterium]|jgi:galactokinase|nr:galactokinase [Gemmataceae bacterium]
MTDFQDLFGRPANSRADAPGRVNLIGEHTDYNGGFVLPTAIPQRCRVEMAARSDKTVRAWSTALDSKEGIAEYDLGQETPGRGWLDYLQGVTRILAGEGHRLRGFDVRFDSQVPLGSGLSSSAAFTVSLMRTLRTEFKLILDDEAIARFGQRVENEFVGARVGIMDPMAASLADEGTALFLDARSLKFRRVALPPGGDLVVIHSGVSHRLIHGDYNTRRGECERAAELLRVSQLRDLTTADLPRIMQLPDPLNRRTRHVVTENDRVLSAVDAMCRGDLPLLGQLFFASHDSQRNDYEVSVPEIDLLVEIAHEDPEVFGARLTGGGFGGSIVFLAHRETGRQVGRRIITAFAARSGQRAKVLVPNQ